MFSYNQNEQNEQVIKLSKGQFEKLNTAQEFVEDVENQIRMYMKKDGINEAWDMTNRIGEIVLNCFGEYYKKTIQLSN